MKHCTMTKVDTTRETGHQSKTWWDCVEEEMKSLGSAKMHSLGINGEVKSKRHSEEMPVKTT